MVKCAMLVTAWQSSIKTISEEVIQKNPSLLKYDSKGLLACLLHPEADGEFNNSACGSRGG